MAGKGINTSGQHSVDSYQLGRGIMYLAELNTDGSPKGFEDLGNVQSLTASVESEKLDHFSTRSGLSVRDKSIVTQVTSNLSFVLEDINFNNLARFFSGAAQGYTNPAIAGVSLQLFVKSGTLKVNQWYALTTTAGLPIFGITSVNTITIASNNATPVALVKDTDYTVNATEGMIFVNDTATTQSVVTAGDGLTVTLTADAAAKTVDQVTVLSSTEVNAAIRFVLEDADTGEKVVYDFHKVTVSSDGDYALISEEWAQLPMTGSVEANDYYDNVADIYYLNDQLS